MVTRCNRSVGCREMNLGILAACFPGRIPEVRDSADKSLRIYNCLDIKIPCSVFQPILTMYISLIKPTYYLLMSSANQTAPDSMVRPGSADKWRRLLLLHLARHLPRVPR